MRQIYGVNEIPKTRKAGDAPPRGTNLLRTGHFSEASLRYYLPSKSRIIYPARLVDVLGRGAPPSACNAAHERIAGGKIEWVLEADLKNFFGSLSHEWMRPASWNIEWEISACISV